MAEGVAGPVQVASRGAAARRVGKVTATETPCDVPSEGELSETDFRLRVALGRAAYNKLFHHNQKLVYYEVNKVWGPNWSRATVMEKADFLQEGAQVRASRVCTAVLCPATDLAICG